IQDQAEIAVSEGLSYIDKRLKAKKEVSTEQPIQVALIAVHPQTGGIKAMIGGRNYAESQFNRVTMAFRQPGSAIKPFVTAVSFLPNQEGRVAATPATVISDEKATFAYAGQEWSPNNFENKYHGNVTVRLALQNSYNVAMVNLAAKAGLENLAGFYQRLGFKDVLPVPSIAIGSIEVTPLQLASAYTIFPNGGVKSDPISILTVTDSHSQRLEQKSSAYQRIIPTEVAFLVTHLMEGVIDQGTARSARRLGLKGAFAGKTGTTNDYKDNWFVGFSKDLVVAIWVGFDDPQPTGLTGGSTALNIWTRLMKNIYRFDPPKEFSVPSDIEWIDIDPTLGCISKSKNVLHEAFLSGTKPSKCR
ncbi:MAG: hypothetical protein KDD48_05555, partial [Bdellovibrionales bacterium]|nr:hypothetical protein [Bdellovibrionales bacterium]